MCLIVTFSIQLHNFIKPYYMYNVIQCHVFKLIEMQNVHAVREFTKGRKYHIESSDITNTTDSMVTMVTVLSLSQDPLA